MLKIGEVVIEKILKNDIYLPHISDINSVSDINRGYNFGIGDNIDNVHSDKRTILGILSGQNMGGAVLLAQFCEGKR